MNLTDGGAQHLRSLAGLHVLLVEDDYLVGLKMRDLLEDLGCKVIGPVPSAKRAAQAIAREVPDAAVLDIHIKDGTSVPIAEELLRAARPFIFVSGFQSPSHLLPEDLRSCRRISKPVDSSTLEEALSDAMG